MDWRTYEKSSNRFNPIAMELSWVRASPVNDSFMFEAPVNAAIIDEYLENDAIIDEYLENAAIIDEYLENDAIIDEDLVNDVVDLIIWSSYMWSLHLNVAFLDDGASVNGVIKYRRGFSE